ncbi:sensor domain-containing phosphodiesterase [Croceicoccus marinus]|uniref:EAL domain-containing protein n=1 Tax=Croceicoccus marinus TaxID=450378 RepID=A0A7G6W189_9SPHN|nr:EAL domain-containing protein [Croceicoccus marinus]QNE07754.1 EAL domain-containing protein [Croceicoccus marinus]
MISKLIKGLIVEHLVQVVANEEARLNALRDLQLLDTPPSESYDRLTRLASRLLAAPVSTISLTDGDRQWFKSKVGVDLEEIPREQAPCSYAIEGGGIFVVPDLTADPRFIGSPLAEAGIRFYAGAPLFTRQGHGLGTICVVDSEPRNLREGEEEVLLDLAGMVMSQIELQNMVGRIDAVTGHANQFQMFEDLEAMARTRADTPVTALAVDVLSATRTTYTTRVLGSECMADLMKTAIRRMQDCAGNRGKVYHVDQTRCAILIEDGLLGGYEMADRIAEALGKPILCSGVPVHPDPVVGTYDFVAGEVSPRDVFRRLSNAGDDAQQAISGKARYNPASDQRNSRGFALLNDFARALEEPGQLSLAYQPRIDLLTGDRAGVEALLRWTHPELGSISPGEFVPLVEQTALARSMTEWVIAEAVKQSRTWQAAGLVLPISINASALNLDEADFAARLLAAAAAGRIEPRHLEIEFTESAVARDPDRVIEQLTALRDAGIGIAIDDFGTGYCNLAYLQKLPVSVLKIDQSFVRSLVTSAKDQMLVRTMIAMGHDLGYGIVAEGIETREAYDMLTGWGCNEGQGYFMSRPVSPRQIMETAGHRSVLTA